MVGTTAFETSYCASSDSGSQRCPGVVTWGPGKPSGLVAFARDVALMEVMIGFRRLSRSGLVELTNRPQVYGAALYEQLCDEEGSKRETYIAFLVPL